MFLICPTISKSIQHVSYRALHHWDVNPTVLPLSRERREVDPWPSQTEARRSSVCSGLLAGPFLEGYRKRRLPTDGADFQNGKAKDVTLTVYLLHDGVVFGLSKIAGFAIKEYLQVIALFVIPNPHFFCHTTAPFFIVSV
jgi:hypothetical protein